MPRAYLSKFNFAGADQQKKLGVLSGENETALHLAMTLREGGNVLLLGRTYKRHRRQYLAGPGRCPGGILPDVSWSFHDRWLYRPPGHTYSGF